MKCAVCNETYFVYGYTSSNGNVVCKPCTRMIALVVEQPFAIN